MNYFVSKASALWEMKPVQASAKTIAAGAIGVAAFSAFGALRGPNDASLKNVKGVLDDSGLDDLFKLDAECVEILSRLEPFYRFSPAAYRDIYESMLQAARIRHDIYEAKTASGILATSSFVVRSSYQKVIESTRVFRAILESKLPSALEDFDEVAVDLNAHVESVCLDALHDSLSG
jgi:hypothetical protein